MYWNCWEKIDVGHSEAHQADWPVEDEKLRTTKSSAWVSGTLLYFWLLCFLSPSLTSGATDTLLVFSDWLCLPWTWFTTTSEGLWLLLELLDGLKFVSSKWELFTTGMSTFWLLAPGVLVNCGSLSSAAASWRFKLLLAPSNSSSISQSSSSSKLSLLLVLLCSLFSSSNLWKGQIKRNFFLSVCKGLLS